jgi:hypothetical protein
MKKIAICQSNYIPWKGYFDLIAKSDVFVIYDEVQYTKNDWRNRNILKTANGPKWITIPIKNYKLSKKINEVVTDLNFWQRKHINMITLNYSRSPFFKEYSERLFSLYENSENLSEINIKFIKEICKIVGIDTQIINSTDLNLIGDRNQRLVDACNKLNATTYISGPAASAYLDECLFNENSINVEWIDYSDYPKYPQLFGEYLNQVSILDLIFNTGPDVRSYLKYVK